VPCSISSLFDAGVRGYFSSVLFTQMPLVFTRW
jgi:hypothetical protein